MSLYLTFGAAVTAGLLYLAAVYLHELTHAAVVWPVSQKVGFDWRGLELVAEVPDERLHQRVADVAGVAPLVIGAFAALVLPWVGVPLPPLTSPHGFVAVVLGCATTRLGAHFLEAMLPGSKVSQISAMFFGYSFAAGYGLLHGHPELSTPLGMVVWLPWARYTVGGGRVDFVGVLRWGRDREMVADG